MQSAAKELLRGGLRDKPVLSSWSAVLDYCCTAMAYADKEELRVLHLDKRNQLIADERQQVGTIDHIWVKPELGDRVSAMTVAKGARAWRRPSDHVPVVATLEL